MEDVEISVDDQQVTEYDQDSQLSLDINKLAKSLRADMEKLHSFSDQCCIYRAPLRLRESNEKIFTPQVVPGTVSSSMFRH
ncbi:hypothetical protein POTOM_014629 [Populus tomentosa]|uniref:Uncharacterized protein n=1 Tax=Populus tomentosa TaxID=118781 RepID=A0A8X8D8M0_POPTO|nr:hypothetical protein POTOM_014629 [Populus tomentosa]